MAKQEAKSAGTAGERTFRVKYNNWPVRDAAIPAKVLAGLDDDGVMRKVMGKAFEQKLKGEWPDADDRKIVLLKASDGMWEGKRFRASKKAEEEFYIMETTVQ